MADSTSYMKRALSLARQALGTTSPNPSVGAVVVKDDLVLGEGFTLPPGQSHAEAVRPETRGTKFTRRLHLHNIGALLYLRPHASPVLRPSLPQA